jgi:hypothetical protein
LAIIGLSGLLMAFRIVPGVVAFWGVPGHPVLPGYRDVWEVVEAFAVLRDAKEPARIIPAGPIFWWEYDLYIGQVGLALVLWFGIGSRWRERPPADEVPSRAPFAAWDGPMLVLAFLSIGPYWTWLAGLPIPLVSSERVPSRFLLLPALLLMLIAVIRLNDWLRQGPRSAFLTALLLGALAELTRGLVEHSLAWHMTDYSDTVRGLVFQRRQVVEIVQRPDPVYLASLFLGLSISAGTAAAWWWWGSREPEETDPNTAVPSSR